MLLHWDQMVLHYGAEIGAYRQQFVTAGQTTYALLCCRFAPGDYLLRPSSGDHAEARLLESEIWTEQIPQALADWDPRGSRIVVTIAINRSPCRNCTQLLVGALNALHRRFPVACDANRFILASRGAYEDSAMQVATTRNDLIRLRDAGWELCVLQVEAALSARGRILLEGLEGIGQRGFVRLEG
jgi:hypothetical protein